MILQLSSTYTVVPFLGPVTIIIVVIVFEEGRTTACYISHWQCKSSRCDRWSQVSPWPLRFVTDFTELSAIRQGVVFAIRQRATTTALVSRSWKHPTTRVASIDSVAFCRFWCCFDVHVTTTRRFRCPVSRLTSTVINFLRNLLYCRQWVPCTVLVPFCYILWSSSVWLKLEVEMAHPFTGRFFVLTTVLRAPCNSVYVEWSQCWTGRPFAGVYHFNIYPTTVMPTQASCRRTRKMVEGSRSRITLKY